MKHSSIWIILSSWLLATMVLTCAYSGELFSKKVAVEQKLPFIDMKTFVQCLEQGRCRIITGSLTISSLQTLISPESEFGDRLEKAIKKNPIIVADRDDIPNYILGEQEQFLVTIGSKSHLLFQIDGNRHCEFYTMDLEFSELQTFPVAKNSTFIPVLNQIAAAFREVALRHAVNLNYNTMSMCGERGSGNRRSKPALKKTDMLYAMAITFSLYGIGILLAVCAFVIELSRH